MKIPLKLQPSAVNRWELVTASAGASAPVVRSSAGGAGQPSGIKKPLQAEGVLLGLGLDNQAFKL
ncbi:hypothetical protein A9299_10150 [Moraxella osloensis]|uniref:Uncharacterized protein n=1 Tax=Faucicola osloensis TaxID=34062 RepID=A0AA91J9U6_FAUOS|nr:hypothetical protein A9299_10150 [Moraxella osloensis]